MRSIKVAVIVALILILAISSVYNPNIYAYAVTAGQTEEKGLISGIVKENNPSLGYLTLYFQDGSGMNPDAFDRLVTLRNFTYGYEIPVIRDGMTVRAESIQPGDQVFLKLDEDGYIQKLSAKSYYSPVYGTVHLKSARYLVLKRENGSFASYPLSSALPVYKNGSPCGLSDILPGDRVRLLVQTNGENIDIAGIEIEKLTTPVSGVYRGNVEFYDAMRDSLAVSGLQEYVNGRWENSPAIGVRSFVFNSEYKSRPLRNVSGTVYFATKKTSDGTYKIAAAAYRGAPGYEINVKDNLLSLTDGSQLELENSSEIIGVDQSTLVIKDGRLVDISALNTLDPVKISVERSSYGAEYRANVLVSETSRQSGQIIYRGRIKSVDPRKSITVESFAQLNGITWSFTNTPKTFDIDLSASRLVEEGGVVNMRNVDATYAGKSVYIVAEGSKIKLMSTAPYAEGPVSGRVSKLNGVTLDNQGSPLNEPTGLVLTGAMAYDTQTHQWNNVADITMIIPKHAVVMKKGVAGTLSLIKPGDEIRVLRHAQSLEGILILCD